MPYAIKIQGGRPLVGTISISGAKNAALPLMCASLLSDQPLLLSNVPDLADIRTMIHLLDLLGVKNEGSLLSQEATLTLHASSIKNTTAPYDLVNKMRASILVLGPLVTRHGEARVSLPGGCAIGIRPVDIHLDGLKKMGATITLQEGYICAQAPCGLKGATIIMPIATVTGTENLMMAATLADGQTILRNAAREPEIVDLADCLRAMGAKITGAGTNTIVIEGVKKLTGAQHRVIPDRIETGTYLMAGLITKGKVRVTNTRVTFVQGVLDLLDMMGARIMIDEQNECIEIEHPQKELKAINITTQPYPGIATDLQAQFMALMTLCQGCSTIAETIWENRFMHIPELNRLGANIVAHGATAHIHGVDKLLGAQIMATDLRASVSLVMAGLAAQGQTHVHRLYHLDRGYERVEEKLRGCGAILERYNTTANDKS